MAGVVRLNTKWHGTESGNLTPLQERCLRYCKSYREGTGSLPSDEMVRLSMNMKSLAGAKRTMSILRARGLLD